MIFVSNNVLTGLSASDSLNTAQGRFIKGWALFNRAFAYYDLARGFCKAYDASTASADLGLPLKLSPNVDELEQRATLQQTYDQIFADLGAATRLLPTVRPAANLNRPSRIAAYALWARIYLDRREYQKSGLYADSCLALYNKLIDYNTVGATSSQPFSNTNDELIYNCRQVVAYGYMSVTYNSAQAYATPDLLKLYDVNDLRLPVNYVIQANGYYAKKRGYYGRGIYPFTGLATDEVYLIKAENLVRAGKTTEAMDILNRLLINRYKAGTFTPLAATTQAQALQAILTERRKELAFRGLRWYDLKRLNKEGANITLSRKINNTNYTLAPNSSLYIFPIPDEEIQRSGIQQNQR
jgi:hypothetical protein